MTPSMWWMLRVVLALLLFAWMSRQVRKPGGLLGRRWVRAMNPHAVSYDRWCSGGPAEETSLSEPDGLTRPGEGASPPALMQAFTEDRIRQGKI